MKKQESCAGFFCFGLVYGNVFVLLTGKLMGSEVVRATDSPP